MNNDALYELIVSAFAKFLAADLSVSRARFGLFGTWVVTEDDAPVTITESQLNRASASCTDWSRRFPNSPNPYADLVNFYESGASLGRWENNILDIYGPDGEKLWGVPLSSLIESANNLR
ncbi:MULTISPECIES: hypothetical protein [unclassified Duganella]|uniref:hypothetical protein n=1 Tax=unclassified Duganella TaxID=2636909 RepID=UPI0011C1572B|nr:MULTISPECIES: hypothetical protein [unclassified Duganella]